MGQTNPEPFPVLSSVLINHLPSLLWFLFVIVLIIIFYQPIRNELIPKLTKFSALGIELSFIKETMAAIIKVADKSPHWNVQMPEKDKERAIKRASRNMVLLRGAQILWLDDHPENNTNERRMFRQLRVDIDTATNREEAITMLKSANYDLVISDMVHDNDKLAGMHFLSRCKEENLTIPVVFYVGKINPDKGVPAGAFSITNRPDVLLHLTIDTMARVRDWQ